MSDEPTAGGAAIGRRDADLAAELVGLVRLAFADALDLGRVQRIDLGQGIAPLLMIDPPSQAQGLAEGLLQLRIALDLALHVADHPPEVALHLA